PISAAPPDDRPRGRGQGMPMDNRRFIDALRRLEEQGDLEPIVALFADSAEIWNPELRQVIAGKPAVRSFWDSYRDTFSRVRSDFRAVIECESAAALEWETRGQLRRTNRPFVYRGVSVLEWSDGQIRRFFAYFDPRALR